MPVKIELINNAVVMTDTSTGEIIGESPKNLVYFNSDKLIKQNIIEIVNISSTEFTQMSWQAQAIGPNTLNSAGEAYTVETFLTFGRTNLGT